MSLLQRLIARLKNKASQRKVVLAQTLHTSLEQLALQERRSPEEVASHLLEEGLQRREVESGLWTRWLSLSARERDVTALACLGYTNRQMAARLAVSAETIKTYMRNALIKFNLHSKTDLRLALSKWDFSAWDNPNP